MTHISYRVDVPGKIHVAVYDLQGRLTEVLVDGNKIPGEYSTIWHGSGFNPGVYFCVIRSGENTMTRKLILTGR
jgi:hypothetical protein